MNSPLRRISIGRCLVIFAILSFPGSPIPPVPASAAETDKSGDSPAPADADDKAAFKKKHAEYLRQMRERVVAAKIHVADADAELIAEPLMRFNNRSLRNVDATLWGWSSGGRLVGVCKLIRMEKFRPDEGPWLFCFTSLSPERVDAEFAVGHTFSAEKPGIELKKIEKGPVPGKSNPERLRQIKELASRFTATTTDYANHSEELRLLPRPIYRYQLPERNKPADGELLDGAIFAMSIEGTAPTALVLIELHHRETGIPEWQFAVSHSTWAALSVKLDGREVWAKPVVVQPGSYDTWDSFWEQTP
jgi:hypothetical protein